MCKAPKPPAPKEPDKPEYLRNPYLDAAIGQSGAVDQLRAGRSSFRIDLGSQTGLGLRPTGGAIPQPNPNTRPAGNQRRIGPLEGFANAARSRIQQR